MAAHFEQRLEACNIFSQSTGNESVSLHVHALVRVDVCVGEYVCTCMRI